MEKYPKRQQKTIVDTVWAPALVAAKRTEDEIRVENLGPWTDFEWGIQPASSALYAG
jgi:hypothetical protein